MMNGGNVEVRVTFQDGAVEQFMMPHDDANQLWNAVMGDTEWLTFTTIEKQNIRNSAGRWDVQTHTRRHVVRTCDVKYLTIDSWENK